MKINRDRKRVRNWAGSSIQRKSGKPTARQKGLHAFLQSSCVTAYACVLLGGFSLLEDIEVRDKLSFLPKLLLLPKELWQGILSHLDPLTLTRLSMANSWFHEVANDSYIWKQLYRKGTYRKRTGKCQMWFNFYRVFV